MYFPYFMSYMSIGVLLAVVVLIWAVRNDQFKEQQRARYLPLEGNAPGTPSDTAGHRWHRLEIYGLMVLAVAGLATSAAVLVFSLIMGAA